MDIRSRPTDPAVEQLARSIYAMFPKCMRCGEAIDSYEAADVRILSHRVVHRERCAAEDREDPSIGKPSGENPA